jgi:hypothetical protein
VGDGTREDALEAPEAVPPTRLEVALELLDGALSVDVQPLALAQLAIKRTTVEVACFVLLLAHSVARRRSRHCRRISNHLRQRLHGLFGGRCIHDGRVIIHLHRRLCLPLYLLAARTPIS